MHSSIEMIQIVTTVERQERGGKTRIRNNNRINKHQLMKAKSIMEHRNNSSSRSLSINKFMTMGWILVQIMEVVMTLIMQASTIPIMKIKMNMISMMGSMPVAEVAEENLL